MENHKRKIIGNIPEEEMKIIEQACKIEKRSKNSLIRKASFDYAKKLILEKEASG